MDDGLQLAKGFSLQLLALAWTTAPSPVERKRRETAFLVPTPHRSHRGRRVGRGGWRAGGRVGTNVEQTPEEDIRMNAVVRTPETLAPELRALARTAALSLAHWTRFFEALREVVPVDRICALLQLDPYTGFVARVAQVEELEPVLGGAGFYADREGSKAFEVIARGEAALVREEEWSRYPDLSFFWPTVRSNIKFPVSFGGWPAVWNVWSRTPQQYGDEDVLLLSPLAAELSLSPFRFEPYPVGLALRQLRQLQERRAALLVGPR
jgi:hypothetical protein